jgi:hypothetical protein
MGTCTYNYETPRTVGGDKITTWKAGPEYILEEEIATRVRHTKACGGHKPPINNDVLVKAIYYCDINVIKEFLDPSSWSELMNKIDVSKAITNNLQNSDIKGHALTENLNHLVSFSLPIVDEMKQLDSMADIINKNGYIVPPMLAAVHHKNAKQVIELLLEKGADIKAREQGGINAIGEAKSAGKVELVEFLSMHYHSGEHDEL